MTIISRDNGHMQQHLQKSLIAVLLFFLFFMSLSPATAALESKSDQRKIIYFSAITLYHPIVMYQKYQPLMKYLSENTEFRFELKLSQNYNDIIQLLRDNQVQLALLGGVTYLKAKGQFNVIPILKPLSQDGRPYYRSVFITGAGNDEIHNISDLRGKSVAFASRMSTSGYLAPIYELYTKGDMTLSDLAKHINLKYHDAVAREVLRGNFDAGAVIDSVAERFRSKGLKIIHVSDPIPGLPIVVRSDTPVAVINEVKKALLSLDYRNLADRAIMDQWDEEFKYGFTEASISDYEYIGEMIDYLTRHGMEMP